MKTTLSLFLVASLTALAQSGPETVAANPGGGDGRPAQAAPGNGPSRLGATEEELTTRYGTGKAVATHAPAEKAMQWNVGQLEVEAQFWKGKAVELTVSKKGIMNGDEVAAILRQCGDGWSSNEGRMWKAPGDRCATLTFNKLIIYYGDFAAAKGAAMREAGKAAAEETTKGF